MESKFFKAFNSAMSGVGNGAIQIKAVDSYLGRNKQYGTLRVTSDGGTTYSTVSLVLNGYREFITLDTPSGGFVTSTDGIVTLTGTSNAKYIYLTSASLEIRKTYVNETNTTGLWDCSDFSEIPGDPGANDAYRFAIEVYLNAPSAPVVLSGESGGRAQATVSRPGSEGVEALIALGRLYSHNHLAIPSGGITTDYCDLTSNINWEVSSSSSWLVVSPMSGRDDARLEISAAKNTGRSSRTATITAKRSGDSSPYAPKAELEMKQDAASTFIEFETKSLTGKVSEKDSETDTLELRYRGYTNGYRFTNLQFSNLQGGISGEIVSIETEEDGEIYEPEGSDPLLPLVLPTEWGYNDSYPFILTVSIHIPDGSNQASGQISLTVSGTLNETASAVVSFQLSDEDYLNLHGLRSDNTLIFEASGGEREITVDTNLDWEIQSV